MFDEFKKKVYEWKELLKNDKDKEREYYLKNIFPLVIEQFITTQNSKIKGNAKYLIISVGMSFEPLILSIKLLKPKRIMFLYSENSEKMIDKIMEYTDIVSSNYDKIQVSEINSLETYEAIKETYIKWEMPKDIYVDFTGGTKAMSASTALAGAEINAKLIYIANSKYMSDFRRPLPGSEFLELIRNPYEVFGAFDEDKAFNLYENYNYDSAKVIFENLYNKVPDPKISQRYYLLHKICELYQLWDSLDIGNCRETCNSILDILNKRVLLDDSIKGIRDKIQKQSNIVKVLSDIMFYKKNNEKIFNNKNLTIYILFMLINYAERRKIQKEYDSAVLVLYRILEIMMQKRLFNYNISCTNFSCNQVLTNTNMFQNEGEFRNKFNYYYKSLYRKPLKSLNFYKVEMMNGYIILALLNDEIIGKKRNSYLRSIMKYKEMRNYSIFAHGFDKITIKDYESFEGIVLSTVRKFCNCEDINFDENMEQLKFLTIDQIKKI